MRRALATWSRIESGEIRDLGVVCDGDRADEMHAMCRLVGREDDPSPSRLRFVALFYESVQQMSWPDDRLGERAELLTKVAYLAWVHARRWRSFADAEAWERRVVEHALTPETVREFLAISAEDRLEELNRRFLGDPAVLLAACTRLRARVEAAPLPCMEEATLLYRWLSDNPQLLGSHEESQYFAAELAWIAAVGSKHCGRYRDSQAWLQRLELCYEGIAGTESIRARAGYVRLAVLHELRSYQEVVAGIPDLKAVFTRLGMNLAFAKCCFLEAITLKEIGRDEDARSAFDALGRDPAVRSEHWLHGMVLTGIAELDGRLGLFEAAQLSLSEARCLLKSSGMPLAVAHLYGVEGELLRDQGLLSSAVDSYRAAVAVYSSGCFPSQAAYLRIVLAETLMAAGRESEAIAEIVAALPVIDDEGLVREGIAAMTLLRESVRRQRADPRTLRDLREQLERTRREGKP